ncbi:SpoIIE family protein phosphatase [Nocardiopsis halophila]|uniref:SpoIIE family protein phosphatase n=1 Tax=Nocardiopsis halophila TaxID=141692 RepID=UPI000375E9F8|nr:SpoIIE family protein phosphatase [Nocardiopsis halophila]
MNRTTGAAEGTAQGQPARGEGGAQAAFAGAPAALAAVERTGAIVQANRAFTEAVGATAEELAGRPWPELLSGADAGRAWDLHRDAFERHEPRPRALGLRRPDGEYRRMTVRVRALPGADGARGTAAAVVMLQETARDEEAVRALTELRTAGSDTALWSLDLRTGRMRELFGPSPLGRVLAGEARDLDTLLARVHPDDIARVRDAVEASHLGRDYEQRFRMTDLVGDERVLHAKARYVEGPGGPRLVGVVDDVTEHVQLIRRLADRRRIEAAQGRQVTELAAKLVSATTVDEVTGLLAEEFVPIFGGSAAGVMLVEDGVLRPYPAGREHTGTAPLIDGRDAADAAYPMGAVVQDRQPRFFESRAEMLERFPAVEPLMARSAAQSWATVPVFGDRRVALGVWQVAWDRPHHATPDERALMLTLAGLAGQALQRVYRQLEELELADEVQRRMLPPQIPHFGDLDIAVRYLPARAGWRVCGDFYDVIRLTGRRVGLVVGDVQGHGVEAAAAMGQIRVAFRAYATTEADPGAVLAETNRLLTETGEIVFATCGYLVLDLDTGRMRAAWAGQPPAIIATEDAYEAWEVETGPPVGVDAESKYAVTERVLRPEETLLMCSDGLVESAEVAMDDGLAATGEALCSMGADVHAAATTLAALAPAGRGDDIAILIARMNPG